MPGLLRSNARLRVFFGLGKNLTIAGDTRPIAAAQRIVMGAMMASAAKRRIDTQAAQGNGQEPVSSVMADTFPGDPTTPDLLGRLDGECK